MTDFKKGCSICKNYPFARVKGCACTECHCHQIDDFAKDDVCYSCQHGSHSKSEGILSKIKGWFT